MAVGVYGYGSTAQKPQSASTIGEQAAPLFKGEPAPFLPQIQGPLPDPVQLASTFSKIAPELAPTQSFFDQAKSAIAGIPQAPVITAPTVAPVTVAFPEGDANRLQQALFESQFQPVRRELERRGGIEDRNLSAQLAAAGLADSGTGVGQRQKLGREVGEQIGSAASAISESATAKALEAKLVVAQQQANIDIQRNLANAQLDFGAQQANARNILERGAFEGNALLSALGLDAARAENVRGQFLSFVDSQLQASLKQSEIARSALADIFAAVLQEQGLQLRAREIALGERRERREASDAQTQFGIQRDQLGLQEKQLAQNDRQLAQQAAEAIISKPPQGRITDSKTGAPKNQPAQIYANALSTLGG